MTELALWFAAAQRPRQIATQADADAAIPNTSSEPPVADASMAEPRQRTRPRSVWQRAGGLRLALARGHGRLIARRLARCRHATAADISARTARTGSIHDVIAARTPWGVAMSGARECSAASKP